MDREKIKNSVLVALFSAIIVICSLITVPATVPFTLQTFAVFLCLNILGAEKGILSILIYILLGVAGLPVFSGFQGGLGALFNVTGGYITGFIFAALTFRLIFRLLRKKAERIAHLVASFSGLLICYISGTIWYIIIFTANGNNTDFVSLISICVLPFIIPDTIKIFLSVILSEKIKKHIKI